MKRTNALHGKNDSKLPLKRIANETKYNYQRIIAPSLGRPKSGFAPTIQTWSKVGRGNITLMKIKDYPVHKYFDDYNEIVDRIKLLHASEVAGNNARNKEIIAIIKELKEAEIIKEI